MRAADLDILLAPDGDAPATDDWMSRWQRRLGTARFVPAPATGMADDLHEAIAAAAASGSRPLLLVGHGRGATEAVRFATGGSPGGRLAGAFLVAPTDLDVDLPAGAPTRMPARPLSCPSFLVASRDDPAMRYDRAEHFAGLWRSLLMDAGPSGHLDAASGHGPWPEGLMLLARLTSQLG